MVIDSEKTLRVYVSDIRIKGRKDVSIEFELHGLKRQGTNEELQDRSPDTLIGKMVVPLTEDNLVWDSDSHGRNFLLDSCVERAFVILENHLGSMMRNLNSRTKNLALQ